MKNGVHLALIHRESFNVFAFLLITAALNLPVLSVLLSVSWILIIRAGDGDPPPFSKFSVPLDIFPSKYSIIRFTVVLRISGSTGTLCVPGYLLLFQP